MLSSTRALCSVVANRASSSLELLQLVSCSCASVCSGGRFQNACEASSFTSHQGYASTTSSSSNSTSPKHAPWTRTRDLTKRKIYKKRMRFLMQIIPENQRREYTFRGVCVAKFDRGWRSAFKIYNVYPGVGGFVQHLPLWMPDLLSLKVVGRVPTNSPRESLLHLLESESTEFAFQEAVGSPQSAPGAA